MKAKHFSDSNIEHIAVMSYLTKLMQLVKIEEIVRIIGLNLNNVFVNKEVLSFWLSTVDSILSLFWTLGNFQN